MFDPRVPGTLFSFIEEFSPEMRGSIPDGETWCLDDIVMHIVDTEFQGYTRLLAILAEDRPHLENYDENAWKALGRRVSLVIARMLTHSTRSLVQDAFMRSGYEGGRQGIHSERGLTSFVELAHLYDAHIEAHLQQARRIAGKF